MLNFHQLPVVSLKCQQFRGFRGAHVSVYMGPPATTWVPMGAQKLVMSPSDHPNFHPRGNRTVSGKVERAEHC